MTPAAADSTNPYDALERLFHEPKRLAIVSALCAVGSEGMTFAELKDECELTDGNLSRHLKTLDEAGVVTVRKSFVGAKPRTTVFVSSAGRDRFIEYLDSLERVLNQAIEAARPGQSESSVPLAKPARC